MLLDGTTLLATAELSTASQALFSTHLLPGFSPSHAFPEHVYTCWGETQWRQGVTSVLFTMASRGVAQLLTQNRLNPYFKGVNEVSPILLIKVFSLDFKPPPAIAPPSLHTFLQDKVYAVSTSYCPSTIWFVTRNTKEPLKSLLVGLPTASGCEIQRGF